ncbi:TraU family protein [Desulfosarcina ovata]|uniref:Conjugal transfer protein TraU n=1 Tax=Desulfosarcina ovata subsp. ovata TaxID=2752305 RepID=A0A5K8A689_9BACT|nr:TraU family protein [Desulfosarcina ovata]BBO87979.1 hypothetical protein DSCOOX_11590 [Desulfosarcina ovata subsp. ovata]
MRLHPHLSISLILILILPTLVGSTCIEQEWNPDGFDYEFEVLGTCECCYGWWCRYGTLIAFWEPHRIIETVKDPYCSPTASQSLLLSLSADDAGSLDEVFLGGTHADHSNTEGATVFAQVHYLTHPMLDAMIDEFDDMCWESSDNGMEYISETDSEWQEIYSSMWWPEASLFATYPMVETCMADAAAAQFGTPIDALYWCLGAWGTLFNMNGHFNQDEYTTGNAGLAARTIAHMGRRGLLMDAASVQCYAISMPIWIKSYFKLQPIRPNEHPFKIPIGMDPLFWSEGLNRVDPGGDNFAWLLWRLRICCAS